MKILVIDFYFRLDGGKVELRHMPHKRNIRINKQTEGDIGRLILKVAFGLISNSVHLGKKGHKTIFEKRIKIQKKMEENKV